MLCGVAYKAYFLYAIMFADSRDISTIISAFLIIDMLFNFRKSLETEKTLHSSIQIQAQKELQTIVKWLNHNNKEKKKINLDLSCSR